MNYFKSNDLKSAWFINRHCWTVVAILISACSPLYQRPAPVYDPYAQKTEPTSALPKVDYPETVQPKSEAEKNFGYPVEKIPAIKRIPPKKLYSNSTRFSPAVLALISEADNRSRTGDLESAVSTLERALRISPRDPSLTYKLAQLRLKQSKPRLAEDLAKKAAFLATNDARLKKQSWLLISKARLLQKNFSGAEQAKLKADSL